MQISIPKGSNLTSIAAQYGTSIPELLKFNPNITDPNKIQAGAMLQIPDGPNAPTANSAAKSLDGAGGGVIKTLPDAPSSPLLQFSSLLNDAVGIARKKREAMATDLFDQNIPKGAVKASTFADFIGDTRDTGQRFVDPLVKRATELSEVSDKSREEIRDIAIKAGENGAPRSQVEKILKMTDVESAILASSNYLKKPKAVSTKTDLVYSPEDKRNLEAAGLMNNPDSNVRSFFLAAPPAFRTQFIRDYAKGNNKDVSITSIGQALDAWEAEEERKKNKDDDLLKEIDNLF